MKQATLWIITQWDNILLCMKKRWFGEWLLNGPGGKQKEWETLSQAMIREMNEETGLECDESDLTNTWVLHFLFEANSDWNQVVNLFRIQNFRWHPQETEEMKPMWFDASDIPYDKMWEDDYIWLPRVLNWEYVEYKFYFGKDGSIVDSVILV